MVHHRIIKKLLVTGSSGLIGSEVCVHFSDLGWEIHGVDNNQRATFFGPQGDTRWNQQRLEKDLPGFRHHELDIRDRQGVLDLLKELKPSAIVHTAAQPSHDRAAAIPFDDFDTNQSRGRRQMLSIHKLLSVVFESDRRSARRLYAFSENRVGDRRIKK